MSAADPVTQDRVYRALKGDYLAGLFEVGTRLDLQGIADRLRSSKTPVREAIHRLVGEGLLEADPAGGFRVCLRQPLALIQLYEWNAHLLISMIHLLRAPSLKHVLDRVRVPGEKAGSFQIATCIARIFSGIAEETGNAEAVAAIMSLNEKLLYTRIADVPDVDEAVRELRVMTNSAVTDVHKSVRRRLEAFHERRIVRQRTIIEEAKAEE